MENVSTMLQKRKWIIVKPYVTNLAFRLIQYFWLFCQILLFFLQSSSQLLRLLHLSLLLGKILLIKVLFIHVSRNLVMRAFHNKCAIGSCSYWNYFFILSLTG